MRILGARIHGILDFATVALLVVGPLLFGLGGAPAAIAWTLAALHLVLTLVTRFPYGRVALVPFMVHGLIELAVGAFLVALPSLAGYAPGSPARRFYLIAGIAILVVWVLTDYRGPRAAEVRPDGAR
jgi:hypothetical protein